MSKRMASVVLPIALASSSALCLVQVWEHVNRMAGANVSDRCDFPDECIASYYPGVYSELGALWVVGAAMSWLVLIVAVASNRRGLAILRLSVIGAVTSMWFFVTPLWYSRDDVGWTRNHQPVGIDLTYAVALLMLAAAGTLYAWELLRLLSSAPLRDADAGPVGVDAMSP